jgi:signal transduction histidine kinase
MEESLQILAEQIKNRNISIIKQFSPDLPGLKCDRDKMRQVFVNILLNAIDAMPDGGMLTIKLESDKNALMRIVFRDTGKGISEEEIHKVFDPFFSASHKTSTGLGLSIARGIVERHGGRITIESKKGKGTDVTITCLAIKGSN